MCGMALAMRSITHGDRNRFPIDGESVGERRHLEKQQQCGERAWRAREETRAMMEISGVSIAGGGEKWRRYWRMAIVYVASACGEIIGP